MVTIQKPQDVFNQYISSNHQFVENLPEARLGYLDIQPSNQQIMNYFYDNYVNNSNKLIIRQNKLINDIRKNANDTFDTLKSKVLTKNEQIISITNTLLKLKQKHIQTLNKLAIVTKRLFNRYGLKSSSLKPNEASIYDPELYDVLDIIDKAIDDRSVHENRDLLIQQRTNIIGIINSMQVPEENEDILVNDLIRILNITQNGNLKLIKKTDKILEVDTSRPKLTGRDPTVFITINNIDQISTNNFNNIFLYHRQFLVDLNDPSCNLVFKVPFSYPLKELYDIITPTSIWQINPRQIYKNENIYNINIAHNLDWYSYNDEYNITDSVQLRYHYDRSLKCFLLTDLSNIITEYNNFRNLLRRFGDSILDRNTIDNVLNENVDIIFKPQQYVRVLDENNTLIDMSNKEIIDALSVDSIYTNYVSAVSNEFLSNLSSNPIIYYIINIVRNHNTIRSIINFIIYQSNSEIQSTKGFCKSLIEVIIECENIKSINKNANLIQTKINNIDILTNQLRDLLYTHKQKDIQNKTNIEDFIESLQYLLIDDYTTQVSGTHKFIDPIIQVLVNKIENVEQMINLLLNEVNNPNVIRELIITLNENDNPDDLKEHFNKFSKFHLDEVKITKFVLKNLRNEYLKYAKFTDILINDANKAIKHLTDINEPTSVFQDYNNLIQKNDRQVEILKNQLELLKKSSREKFGTIGRQKLEIQELEREVTDLEADLRNVRNELNTSETEKNQLNGQAINERNKMLVKMFEIETLRKRVQTLETNLQLTEMSMGTVITDKRQLNEQVRSLTNQLGTLNNNNQQLTNQLGTLNNNNQQLTNRVTVLTERLGTANTDIATLKQRIEDYKSEIKREERRVNELLDKRNKIIDEQDEKITELKTFAGNINRFLVETQKISKPFTLQELGLFIRHELSELDSQVEQYAKMHEHDINEIKKVRSEMDKLRQQTDKAISEKQTLLDDIKSKNTKLEGDKQHIISNLQQMKETIQQLEREKVRLTQQNNTSIEELRKENIRLISELTDLRKQLQINTLNIVVNDGDSEEIKQLKQLIIDANTNRDAIRGDFETYKKLTTESLKQLEDNLRQLKLTTSSQEKVIESIKIENTTYKQKLQQQNIEITDLRKKLDEAAQKTGEGINQIVNQLPIIDETSRKELERLKQRLGEKEMQLNELNSRLLQAHIDNLRNYDADLTETIRRFFDTNEIGDFSLGKESVKQMLQKIKQIIITQQDNPQITLEQLELQEARQRIIDIEDKMKNLSNNALRADSIITDQNLEIKSLEKKVEEFDKCTQKVERLTLENTELKDKFEASTKKISDLCDTLKNIFELDRNSDCDQLIKLIQDKLTKKEQNNDELLVTAGEFNANILIRLHLLENIRLDKIKLNLLLKEPKINEHLIKQKNDDIDAQLIKIEENGRILDELQKKIDKNRPGLFKRFDEFFNGANQKEKLDKVLIEIFNDITDSKEHKDVIDKILSNSNQLSEDVIYTLNLSIKKVIDEQKQLVIELHNSIDKQFIAMTNKNVELSDTFDKITPSDVSNQEVIQIIKEINKKLIQINKDFYDRSKRVNNIYIELIQQIQATDPNNKDINSLMKWLVKNRDNKSLENNFVSMYRVNVTTGQKIFYDCMDKLKSNVGNINAIRSLTESLNKTIEMCRARGNIVENYDQTKTEDVMKMVHKIIDNLSLLTFDNLSIKNNLTTKIGSFQSSFARISEQFPNFKDEITRLLTKYQEQIDLFNKLNNDLEQNKDDTTQVLRIKSDIKELLTNLNMTEIEMMTLQSTIVIQTKIELTNNMNQSDHESSEVSENESEQSNMVNLVLGDNLSEGYNPQSAKELSIRFRRLKRRYKKLKFDMKKLNPNYVFEIESDISSNTDKSEHTQDIPHEIDNKSVHTEPETVKTKLTTSTQENPISNVNNALVEYNLVLFSTLIEISEFIVSKDSNIARKRLNSAKINNMKDSFEHLKQISTEISDNSLLAIKGYKSIVINLANEIISESMMNSNITEIDLSSIIENGEIDLMMNKISEFEQTLSTFTNYISIFNKDDPQIIIEVRRKLDELNTFYPEIIGLLKTCLMQKNDDYNESKTQITKLKNKITALNDEQTRSTEILKENISTIKRLESINEGLHERINELQTNITNRESDDVKRVKLEKDQLNTINQQLSIEKFQCEKELADLETKIQELEQSNLILTQKIQQNNLQDIQQIDRTLGSLSSSINSDTEITRIISIHICDIVLQIFLNILISVNNNINPDISNPILNKYHNFDILTAITFDEMMMFDIIIKYLSEPFNLVASNKKTNTRSNDYFIRHINYLIRKLRIKSKVDNEMYIFNGDENIYALNLKDVDFPANKQFIVHDFITKNQEILNNINPQLYKSNIDNNKPNTEFRNLITPAQQLYEKMVLETKLLGIMKYDIIFGGTKKSLKTNLLSKYNEYFKTIMYTNLETDKIIDSIQKLNLTMDTSYFLDYYVNSVIDKIVPRNELTQIIINILKSEHPSIPVSFAKLFKLTNLTILKSELFTEDLLISKNIHLLLDDNDVNVLKMNLSGYLKGIYIYLLRNIFQHFGVSNDDEIDISNIFDKKVRDIYPMYMNIIKSNKINYLNVCFKLDKITEKTKNNIINNLSNQQFIMNQFYQ